MAKKYRVCVIGMVHDHVWGLTRDFLNCENAELVAAADENEPLREKIQRERGVKSLYSDWREMIEKEEIDCALICTENSAAADIVEALAEKGIHAMVEKPMAANLAQADRMLKATEDAGTRLFINWATAWKPCVREAVRRVKAGDIGDVFLVRVRMAHQGPKELGCSPYFYGWLYNAGKNGAGAFMDYCCYGTAFCRYLLGMPRQVSAVAGRLVKDYISVDDNAILIMIYEKAFAVAEASWTQIPAYHDMLILGSAGTMYTEEGKLFISTAPKEKFKEVELPELPEGERNGAEYFLRCIKTGEEIEGMCNPRISRDAQEILEAGLLSVEKGRRIDLPLKG